MSAILGIFDARRQLPADAVVRAMLGEMRARGAERVDLWRGEDAVIAVARHAWELEPGFSGSAMVVVDGSLVVAADASLYYRRDLQRKLSDAGVPAADDTPSRLVLAAYQAWGADCASRLEGDFAFLVYDRATRRVFASRDFAGRRPLFYLEQDRGLVVGSAISGVSAHPAYREEINLPAVASVAAGLLGASSETVYRGIFSLPAGQNLLWEAPLGVRTAPHFEPPIFESGSELGFDEAAEVLRALLCDATAERFAVGGKTSVWMSGGWDSTAVFGAGQQVLRERHKGECLEVISISYPPGDPGREDELIEAITGHWNCSARWLHIDDMPFFENVAERAAARDEPLTHVYETWNRALMAATRAAGSRVALDGMGGDGLFQVSPIFLADLLRTGRWLTLVREWRAKKLRFTKRDFFKTAVQPALPPALLSLATLLRGGRPLHHYMERSIPRWIDRGFVERHGMAALTKTPVQRRPGESASACETQWHLRTPWVPAILSWTSSAAVSEGLEIRSPLYDRRVIEFAATRPREERSQGGETKRLLRRAMRGLLPEHVLTPRTHRTGVTSGYLDRSMRSGLAPLLNEAFGSTSLLAEAGIVDVKQLRRSTAQYLRRQYPTTAVELLMTLNAELWLRSHAGRGGVPAGRDEMQAALTAGATN